MSLLAWITLFCVIGGVLSVVAAGAFLVLPQAWRTRALPHMVSFAVGALLGAAFLGLLPHALAGAGPEQLHLISAWVLLGILIFFLLEKLVLWRHCHTTHCEVHGHEEHAVPHKNHAHTTSGALVIFGDAVHNYIDGMLIGAAFMTDIHLGVVTSLAVAAHEIPQELGNFAVLLESGYRRARAFSVSVASSFATVAGGLTAYFALAGVAAVLPYVLAVAASSFIYVAVADLIPGLHQRAELRATVQQTVLIASGVVVIFVAHTLLH